MDLIAYLVSVLFWIGIAASVGAAANRKRFNYWVYFAFSLVASPWIALTTLRVADQLAKKKEASPGDSQLLAKPEIAIEAKEEEDEYLGEGKYKSKYDILVAIRKLSELSKRGAISKEEFRQKRRELIDRLKRARRNS